MSKPTYDSTVARIAGNILSDMRVVESMGEVNAVTWAVYMARKIVAEVQRQERGPVKRSKEK